MKIAISALALSLAALSGAHAAPAGAAHNVVLVHGSFADGSGWEAVTKILVKDGYNVSVAQPPETSLADDAKAVTRILAMQNGPTVLVGHSYGGAIITEAGNDPKVSALVYVTAFVPDTGEPTIALNNKMPPATKGIKPVADGYLGFDRDLFPADFAGDVPKAKAEFMARSQVYTAISAFTTPITKAAWRSKPSFYLVATDDRAINPELERWMAKRANAKTSEIKGSHASYISHPEAVAKLIEEAAAGQQ